jgi:hypothetical protein
MDVPLQAIEYGPRAVYIGKAPLERIPSEWTRIARLIYPLNNAEEGVKRYFSSGERREAIAGGRKRLEGINTKLKLHPSDRRDKAAKDPAKIGLIAIRKSVIDELAELEDKSLQLRLKELSPHATPFVQVDKPLSVYRIYRMYETTTAKIYIQEGTNIPMVVMNTFDDYVALDSLLTAAQASE